MELMWYPMHNFFSWMDSFQKQVKEKMSYISKDNLDYAVVTDNAHSQCLNTIGVNFSFTQSAGGRSDTLGQLSFEHWPGIPWVSMSTQAFMVLTAR